MRAADPGARIASTPGGGMIREPGAQHRFIEGVAGLLRSGMSVHIDQAGQQPAAVGQGAHRGHTRGRTAFWIQPPIC